MSHTWRHHIKTMNKSCHTHECAMPNTRMSDVTLYHTSEWVVSHTWIHLNESMSHTWIHLNESCHTHEYIWMSHVTHIRKSCIRHTHRVLHQTSEWVMPHTWRLRVTPVIAHNWLTIGFISILHMGWLVGSIKSYVSFAEYRLFYRALNATCDTRDRFMQRLLLHKKHDAAFITP